MLPWQDQPSINYVKHNAFSYSAIYILSYGPLNHSHPLGWGRRLSWACPAIKYSHSEQPQLPRLQLSKGVEVILPMTHTDILDARGFPTCSLIGLPIGVKKCHFLRTQIRPSWVHFSSILFLAHFLSIKEQRWRLRHTQTYLDCKWNILSHTETFSPASSAVELRGSEEGIGFFKKPVSRQILRN